MSKWIAIGIITIYVIWAVGVNWTSVMGAPFVPTTLKRVKKMLKMAGACKDDIIYDLGSGDGRIVIMAAKVFNVKKAVGVEIDPLRVIFSKILVLLFGVRKTVKIKTHNFFTMDLSDATIITCFTLPETNEELFVKLNKELKPGSKVVANRFIFPHWTLIDEDSGIYMYKVMDFHNKDNI